MGAVMHVFGWAKYLWWIVFPMVMVWVLVGCEEAGYELGDVESEVDACQWAIVHYAADELELSPVKESMEAVIGVLKSRPEAWAQDAGLFLDTVELADKEVEEAAMAHSSGKTRHARIHIEAAMWLLRSALKEAERLEFDPNLGSIDSPSSPISRGIREEEGREQRIPLPPGDAPWDPIYMHTLPPPAGYLVEGGAFVSTYLEITIWRLQLAKDHLL
jgi:hypothetical protein